MLSTRHKSRRTPPTRRLHYTVRLHPGLQAMVDAAGPWRMRPRTLTPPAEHPSEEEKEEEEEEKTPDAHELPLPVFLPIPRGYWVQQDVSRPAATRQ